MVEYNRRTGNGVTSVMSNFMPYYGLVADMKDRKRADKDYGLKRQWEEEDRALRHKQLDENKALSAEERAYQRSRDAKQDMLSQEQRDYATEDRLWKDQDRQFERQKYADTSKRQAEADAFNKKLHLDQLAIQQRLSEVKGLNPQAENILSQVQESYKGLITAINNGDQEAVKTITGMIQDLNTQYNQIMGKSNTMGLGNKVRMPIPKNTQTDVTSQNTGTSFDWRNYK